MKKILFSLMAMVFVAFSTMAQTVPACSLKAKFDFKVDKCTVTFKDFSAAATGTTITNWYWDFGDATTSTIQNPTHTYTTNGTYNVCLTIVGVNSQGVKCKDQFCLPVKIDGCGQIQPCKLYPKFDFKADKCNVTFIDYSAAGPGTTITNWYWDFGDGNTSTLQNPSHLYTTPGTYNVCLVIVGNNGLTKCKEQICLKVTVDGCGNTLPCGIKPLFKFKVDKCTVYFIDNSGTNTGTTITSWYWTFGDATTSTLQNPTHTYTTAGTYTVCLTTYAKNANGEECKNTYCYPVTVQGCGQEPCGIKPLFDFKIDKCTVYFVDQTGTNTGTTITSWYWTFGDATTSTLQNPTHTYATAGTYTVCLTAYGVNAACVECKNTYCKKVTVDGCGQIEPCKVAAKFDYKVDKCTVYFADLSAVGVGTTITNWYWDFGDATTSTLQNPTHTYTTAGTYTVCLTIVGTNSAGQQCKDRYCTQVTVDGCGQTKPCKAAAKFDYKVEKCTVYFADLSAVGAGTTITNWYWSFGDATTSTLQNPTHVYATAGTYTVCLTIVGVNAAGQQCKDQYCTQVTVDGCGQTEPCKLAAKFTYKIDKCSAYFTDLSAAGVGTSITNWYWDFGDGNTSTLQNPTHVYATPGTYLVCLVIVGVNPATGEQCKDRFCQEIKADGCGQTDTCLVAGKFDYKVDGCTVYFTDYSATSPNTIITYWEWNFGDGNTVTGVQNPSHVYAAPGNYVACLIIVGTNTITGEQCKDKVCLDVVVKDCDPQQCAVYPKFDYKVDRCIVNFTDFSGVGAGTTITNWYWNFGDGNTSTLQNPSHTYSAAGTYEVCLIVVGVNAAGVECKDILCLKIDVGSCDKGISIDKASNISALEIYPNPAQKVVHINFKTSSATQVNVSISDIQGRVLDVIQDGQMISGNHNLSWNVNVGTGLYLITIKTDAGIEQRKLIIQE